jgi:hypothetical protein
VLLVLIELGGEMPWLQLYADDLALLDCQHQASIAKHVGITNASTTGSLL